MHRWIYIPEGPFICWKLTVGMHIPLAQHQEQLFLREIRIDQR